MTELQMWIIIILITLLAAFNAYQVFKTETYQRKITKRAMELLEAEYKENE